MGQHLSKVGDGCYKTADRPTDGRSFLLPFFLFLWSFFLFLNECSRLPLSPQRDLSSVLLLLRFPLFSCTCLFPLPVLVRATADDDAGRTRVNKKKKEKLQGLSRSRMQKKRASSAYSSSYFYPQTFLHAWMRGGREASPIVR